MPLAEFTPYSSAAPLLSADMLPTWQTPIDAARTGAYKLYEEIWRNIPQTFSVVQRGTEDNPIYIPSAKKCIEATNRYLGVGFDYTIVGGNGSDRGRIGDALSSLFRREKFYAKFNSLKRFSLVRGDALWHVKADPTMPVGRRLSLHELDPGSYFPIYDPDDNDKLLGVHIAEPWVDPADPHKPLIKRQTYRKVPQPNGPNQISSECIVFEASGWDDRRLLLEPSYQLKPYRTILSLQTLPPPISAIPVYHVQNQYESRNPYGVSELAGFERLIAAVNQAITDEELTLALDGLGAYWTTSARPESGEWQLGPGSVIEGAAGEEFIRVSGTGSVEPFQQHLAYLDSELKQAMATPDIAIGNVNVQIAQSGIALALQMGPILTRNREKEAELLAIHDHLLFDLTYGWFPAYEELDITSAGIDVNPGFADPMPVDRAAVLDEIINLVKSNLVSVQYAQSLLTEKLGYEFPDQMNADIIAELQARTSATAFDPYAERIRAELAGELGEAGQVATGASNGQVATTGA